MSISSQIQAKLKEAMKAKAKSRLTALRGIKAALQHATLEKNDGDLALSEELKVLQKLAKQRSDSMTIYKEQGRDDLYAVEAAELETRSGLNLFMLDRDVGRSMRRRSP